MTRGSTGVAWGWPKAKAAWCPSLSLQALPLLCKFSQA